MNNKNWKSIATENIKKKQSKKSSPKTVKINVQHYEDYKKQVIEESENK